MLRAIAEGWKGVCVGAEELTWNIRDRHMVETVQLLLEHLQARGIPDPKIVICKPLSFPLQPL